MIKTTPAQFPIDWTSPYTIMDQVQVRTGQPWPRHITKAIVVGRTNRWLRVVFNDGAERTIYSPHELVVWRSPPPAA